MSVQLGFVFDPKRCRGCKSCEVACKAENNTRPYYANSALMRANNQDGRPEINYREVCFQRTNDATGAGLKTIGYRGRRFLSVSCHHCTGTQTDSRDGETKPPCAIACPMEAIEKSIYTGIVTIDRTNCIGCRRCNFACPYGAPRYNGKAENQVRSGYGVSEKCTLCNHLITGSDGSAADATGAAAYSSMPACVRTCVGKALRLNYAGPGDATGVDGVSFSADAIDDSTAKVGPARAGTPTDGTTAPEGTAGGYTMVDTTGVKGFRVLSRPAPSPMGRHTPKRNFPGRDLNKDAIALPNTVWIN